MLQLLIDLVNKINDIAKKLKTKVVSTRTDLNDYVDDGWYFFAEKVTPTNIPAGVNGWLQVVSEDGQGNGFIKQFWYRAGTPGSNDYQTFVRTKSAVSEWGSWTRLGGTDFVVDQGVKNGWTYRKWNSGIAECWIHKEGSGNVAGGNTMVVELPFSFYDTNFVVEATRGHNGSIVSIMGDYDGSGNRVHGYGYFYFRYILTSAYYPTFNFKVTGLWKQLGGVVRNIINIVRGCNLCCNF